MTHDIHPDAIQSLLNSDHGSPIDLLGVHKSDDETLSIRTFRPNAKSMVVVHGKSNERIAMECIHDAGFFVADVPANWDGVTYFFEVTDANGEKQNIYDPYAYPPMLSDFDLHLFGEGKLFRAYEKFGAQIREEDGVRGVNFAVWAPNAFRVSVIGDFNDWDARVHPMQYRGVSGVWELFIPGLEFDTTYKFDIKSRAEGFHSEKADPFGLFSELRPKTGSIVTDLTDYEWDDDIWISERQGKNPLTQPMSIYEVHLGSWKRDKEGNWLNYRELAEQLVEYCLEMEYTHIELMPVMEHPLDASWGYQVTGYYAPTSRFGTPQDFMYFVDHCHQNNIGVILDWVPAHFPKDGFGLNYFDGTHLYEHADPRQGEHPDWGTLIFNYGRNEVRNFLIANALFWLDKYHIDGLRVDAVASMLYLDYSREDGQWVPNMFGGNENLDAIGFLKECNEIVHREYPGTFTVAEESTAFGGVSRPTYVGGLGFTFKWNMGWMHDTLEYIKADPIYRRYKHNLITFSSVYSFSENFILSLSHDEVVHGKGSLLRKVSGDVWQKFATLRTLYGYQATFPGKLLNFMGQEFGQWDEWNAERSLDWHLTQHNQHQQLQAWVRDLNRLIKEEPALYATDADPEGFRWIEVNDANNSAFAYMRIGEGEDNVLVVLLNFTPVPRHDYRIGVPKAEIYQELINSDSELYGGSNVGNLGQVAIDPIAWHGYEQSLRLTLPPLSCIVLKPQNQPSTGE